MKTVMLLTPVKYNKETDASNQFARIATRNSLMADEAPLAPALLWNGRDEMNLAIATWAVAVSEVKFFRDPNDMTAITLVDGSVYKQLPKLDKRVIIESPFAGDIAGNLAYLERCIADCFDKDEAPIASHKVYTQEGILRDGIAEERQAGIDAGLELGLIAQATIVYQDFGISRGMEYGIAAAEKAGRPIIYRKLSV